ncbi:MAG: hypothetical protein V3W34_08310 [Phycisphaerae bacterium]
MIRSLRRVGGGVACCTWMSVAVLGGCAEKTVKPVRLANDTLGVMTIAVAPALNVSGTAQLDPNRVADLMASELSYVADIEVIPVNRVLAVLADQGRERVESPGHALEIAKILGADAILVFAVTEYDAYDPPVVGLAAQLYGKRRRPRTVRFDPVAESRAASPSRQWENDSPLAPIAQAERVFDASHEWVCAAVRRFAESRSADASPFGWRKYIASQQSYLRFCCHETIRAMTHGVESEKVSDSSGAG